jgi:hypothetical protein
LDISVNEKFPIEDLFDQATEDTSHYLWATEAWFDTPEGYEKDYLLILAFAHRARSRRALELIDSNIPPDYRVYKKRLENMHRTAERELYDLVLNDTAEIDHIVSTQLMERLNSLEELLKKISDIAQDGDLIEDPDWVAEDLRDTSLDFLIRFQEFVLMGEEFKTSPFDSAVNSQKFRDRLKAIDSHFKQCFGYFHAIRDMLPDFQRREYGRKCWWFDRVPNPDDVQENENIDSLVQKMAHRFQAEKDQASQECPKADKTTAYARGELDLEEGNKIREHIHSCRNCLNVFLDVKIAEEKARIQDGYDEVIYPSPEPVPEPIIDKLKTKISEFLSPLFKPTPIPALATVCLVIFISVYALMNEPAEVTLLGRTYQEFRGGEAKYSEFQVDKGGTLKSGDFFRSQVKIDQDAYIYIVFHDSEYKISGINRGFIAADERIFLPDESNWFQLDNNPGQETIYVLSSENEILDFEDRIEKLKNAGIAKIDKIFPGATIIPFSFKHE